MLGLRSAIEPLVSMHLFFDLDGTITDPAVGFTRSLQHAMSAMGLAPAPAEELVRFIGPPLHESIRKIFATSDDRVVSEAIEHYRERYAAVGVLENRVYSGIPEGLSALSQRGFPLYVATSKPSVFADRVIDHFGLRRYFRVVYGSEISGERSNKGELLEYLLAREGIDAKDAWMIGDREHDVLGARKNGIAAISVSWGYGSREELFAAGASAIVDSMSALRGDLGVAAIASSISYLARRGSENLGAAR